MPGCYYELSSTRPMSFQEMEERDRQSAAIMAEQRKQTEKARMGCVSMFGALALAVCGLATCNADDTHNDQSASTPACKKLRRHPLSLMTALFPISMKCATSLPIPAIAMARFGTSPSIDRRMVQAISAFRIVTGKRLLPSSGFTDLEQGKI